MKTRKALLILSGVLAASSTVYADKVTLSATPPSVQETVRSKAGVHAIEDIDRETRNGQVTYEVSWKNNAGVQQELLLSENGQILRDVQGDNPNPNVTATPAVNNENYTGFNRTPVELSDTPRAVQAAVYTKIPNAPIDSVARGSWNGRTFYEVTYQENGQPKTYRVDENGKPMENFSRGRWQPQFGFADANVALTGSQKITYEALPRNVQRTMNYVANGARLDSVLRGQWNGRTVYGSFFQRNGETVALQVFDDGSVVTKTPGMMMAGATKGRPAAKKGSFFDQAAEFLGSGTANQPATPAISLANAPQAVQQTINQSTRGAALQDLQRSDWNGRSLYEASFHQNGQNMKLQVLDDGSILSLAPASTAVGSPGSSQTGSGRGY